MDKPDALRARIEEDGEQKRGLFGRIRSYAAIRRENAELRAEVKRLRRLERVTTGAGSFAGRVFVGSELREAAHAWTKAVQGMERPRDLFGSEAADFAAAIVRRVVRVGLVGLVVAALPMIMLTWQNILIQMQVKQQASDTLIVRRAQLLDKIYDEICEQAPKSEGETINDGDSSGGSETEDAEPDAEKTELVCRPRAHIRARQEAVLAFAEIERGRGQPANLRSANLTELDLFNADLRQAYLIKANLGKTILFRANLSKANLHEANLSEATLWEAEVIGADLSEANLDGANLSGASLFDADLRAARLYYADLSEAHGLTQEQIDSAYGDENTRLPEGLTRPDHWTTTSAPAEPE